MASRHAEKCVTYLGLGFVGFLGFLEALFEMLVFVFSRFLGSFRRGISLLSRISGKGVFVESEMAGRDVVTVFKYHIARNRCVIE